MKAPTGPVREKVERRRRAMGSFWAVSIALCFSFLLQFTVGISGAKGAEIRRFFRMGSGRIHIHNAHNGLDANVRLLNHDGSLNEAAFFALDRVFGFSSSRQDDHVSLRLIFLLDYFSQKVAPGSTIELYSGYRSPEYNRKLRLSGGNVAPTSTHKDAMAIDFSLKGVSGRKLWETVRKEECCGIGYYGGNSVHLDSGKPRFWEAATSKVNSGESEFNRRIYLSTQYDRYRPGEYVRLDLSSVSDYAFGVKRAIDIVGEDGTDREGMARSSIRADEECVAINDRNAGRSIYAALPEDLPPGRYRIRVEFCNVPFPQMPARVVSNPLEVVAGSPPGNSIEVSGSIH
jgi:uncharacterized protein YcbK (DUF882 family)